MSLFNRLEALVRADAHGVVDAVEDRNLLLRQHVREAEVEVERKRARVEAIAAERRGLDEKAKRLQQQAASLDEDIAMALERDKEELARFSIKKLLPLKHALTDLEQRAKELESEHEILLGTLAEQEQLLSDLKSRAKSYLQRRGDDIVSGPRVIADEEIELELLRRKQEKGEAVGEEM